MVAPQDFVVKFQGTIGAARQMLDTEAADAAWMQGCAMPLEQAIAEALRSIAATAWPDRLGVGRAGGSGGLEGAVAEAKFGCDAERKPYEIRPAPAVHECLQRHGYTNTAVRLFGQL